jgi:hypothetical protein
MITAKQARENVLKANVVSEKIRTILMVIEETSKKGLSSIYEPKTSFQFSDIELIKNLGFNFEEDSEDGFYYKISW